jgi:hypothetical protein
VHDEALLRPREDPEQAAVLLGVRNAEMSERLRRNGSVALRIPSAARRREYFVSHAYIVPHATDKTRSLRNGRDGIGQSRQAFFVFGLIVLPTLAFVGLVTFDRALQSGIEDLGYARRIAMLRGYYFDVAPEITPYLLSVRKPERLSVQGLRGRALAGVPDSRSSPRHARDACSRRVS